jgi:ABC-type amino acid transport substrate-binding protein
MRWTQADTLDNQPATVALHKYRVARVLFLVGCLIALPTLADAADPVDLQLASDVWPPFTDVRDGQRVAIDLVQTALDRAGISATTTIVDWKDVEAGIRDKKFDGSAAMWRTDAREEILIFSEPYLENRLVLVGRKGADVAATRISDLSGKRVAAVGRYAYGDQIKGAVGVYFVNSKNDQDSLDKLLGAEVDYMLVDELVVRYMLTYQREDAVAKLEIGTTPLARRSLHFAIRRALPGAEDTIAAFNREIHAMLNEGTYAEILHVGWILFDVDGDGLDELVALGDVIGQVPPGTVYDVFGKEPVSLPEKQRVFIKGNVYEGWDAIPDRYKGPAGPMENTFKYGTTVFTLQF